MQSVAFKKVSIQSLHKGPSDQPSGIVSTFQKICSLRGAPSKESRVTAKAKRDSIDQQDMDQASPARPSPSKAWPTTSPQHCKPATTRRGPPRPQNYPSQQGHNDNTTRGRGRGPQQPRRFYSVFHGEDSEHPTRDCPETKATKDRMARVAPADNQRSIAHTYQPHPYNHHHYQNEHSYSMNITTIQLPPVTTPSTLGEITPANPPPQQANQHHQPLPQPPKK